MTYVVKLTIGEFVVNELSCNALQDSILQHAAGKKLLACSTDPITAETTVTLLQSSLQWTERIVSIAHVVPSATKDLSIDYAHLASLWSVAFTSVVGLYLVSHTIALLLQFVRRV